jgi:hypothetical protein
MEQARQDLVFAVAITSAPTTLGGGAPSTPRYLNGTRGSSESSPPARSWSARAIVLFPTPLAPYLMFSADCRRAIFASEMLLQSRISITRSPVELLFIRTSACLPEGTASWVPCVRSQEERGYRKRDYCGRDFGFMFVREVLYLTKALEWPTALEKCFSGKSAGVVTRCIGRWLSRVGRQMQGRR